MTTDEIFDNEPTVSVYDAIQELNAHGHEAFFGGGSLMVVADNPMDMALIVTDVDDDEMVNAKKVLEWLGY